jgi:RNA polymerase sigma factor (sigma-70 family)
VGRTASSRQDSEFEEFFSATWERAVALGVRMGLSRPESEDVALDALAVAYDRWPRVRDLPWRDGWVLKVAGNGALRQLKRNSRRAQFASSPVRLLDEEVTDRMALRSGLAGLSRRQREVITLRYLADMPEAEVAEVLGLEVGTVKQHASRARAVLKGALDVVQPGGEHGG